MADKNNTKPKSKLDSYAKIKLGHAYMSLYDALVAECQTQNKTLGKSWFDALKRIHEIVKSKKSENQKVVLDYLMDFYNSHRETQLKKMMVAKDKDLTIQTNAEKTRAATERVKAEIKKFDDAVKSVTDKGEVLLVLKPVASITTKSFSEWVENQPNEIVVDFDNDPKSLERAYRKYVMQKSK